MQLKTDCEKEIDEAVSQIRRKYETKIQEMEAEFLLKKKEMDGNQNSVLMNKILAEAFRYKFMDPRLHGSSGIQQGIVYLAPFEWLKCSNSLVDFSNLP